LDAASDVGSLGSEIESNLRGTLPEFVAVNATMPVVRSEDPYATVESRVGVIDFPAATVVLADVSV